MKTVRVRVENGRITGHAPPDFPEGEVELRLVEPEDEMTDDELDRLDEALARGFEQVASGQLREATEVVDALRKR